MSFKRIYSPSKYPTGLDLTRRCISIGFGFAENPSKQEPNIEETLVAASLEGVNGDYRILSLLVDWFDIHSTWVNADHLTTLVKAIEDKQVQKFWTACAQWKKTDPRFKKLRKLYEGERFQIMSDPTGFLLKRNGEDPRFKETVLLIPNKTLRHRPTDIDPPERLSKINKAYRYRVLLGPTYRADLLAALEEDPSITTAELARKCYSGFSAAWEAKKDFEILNKVS